MIWNILKLMFTRWTSMVRWNNFPRIEDVSHLDNVWFVIHISLFLAYLEEKNWKKIDKQFIIKRIIFNSFSRLVLSDINSWTRDYIIKEDATIFNELEKKAFDYLLGFEWHWYIKDDIIETINNKEKTLELNIINVSKKYAWFIECSINSKVFDDMYEVPINLIEKELLEKSKKLYSLNLLWNNNNYKKYLLHIRRLSHSIRWNQQTRKFPISVMSHLVTTTFIWYILWKIENNSQANIDIEELLLRTMFHDIPEAITWDIITPTKKAVKWFDKLLEKVEIKMMNDYVFSYIDKEYKEKIFDYIFKPFESELWKIAKTSDILSALFESKIEVEYWSNVFKEIYWNIKNIVNKNETKSVDYILKYVIDDFDKDLYDIHLWK